VSDLERELTSVLAQQAGPSHGDPHAALAEHERRLAARAKTVRNRSVAGVMAVVAVIGVSSALVLNGPSEPSQRVATQPTATQPTAPATDPAVSDAVKLLDFEAEGAQWTAYVVINKTAGSSRLHIVAVPTGESLSYPDPYFTLEDQSLDSTVHQGEPLIVRLANLPGLETDEGALTSLTLWATVPEVAEISVVRAGGDTITASLVDDTMADVKLFVTSSPIVGAQRYTFRDAAGTVLRDEEF